MSSAGAGWRTKRRRPVRMPHKDRTLRRPRSLHGMRELEGANPQTFELPNVLFVGSKLQRAQQLLQEREVINR
jgi:hypothetical protein